MAAEKVVIPANNKWCKALLRFDLLAIPFWAFACPGMLFYALLLGSYHDHWHGIPLVIIAPIVLYLCARSLWLTLSNRITIGMAGRRSIGLSRDDTSPTITLPQPRRAKLPLSQLKALSIDNDRHGRPRYLRLTFDLDRAEVLRSRLSSSRPPRRRSLARAAKLLGNPRARVKLVKNWLESSMRRASDWLFDETTATGERVAAFERVSLTRVRPEAAKVLLQTVERWAPGCNIEDAARNYLSGQHKDQHSSVRQEGNKLELRYHAHEKIRGFFNLVGTYEWIFWSVYLFLCALPLIICAPLAPWLVRAVFSKLAGSGVPPSPEHFVSPWMSAWGDLGSFLGSTLSRPAGAYFNFITNPTVACALAAVCLFCLVRFLKFLMQPNFLVLSQDALTLERSILGRRLKLACHPWDDFQTVSLEKPKGTTSEDQWLVRFSFSKRRKPLDLKLSAIKGMTDRETMLRFIERNAEHLRRDHELIETLLPGQSQSYTELWLQSLATPPKRERLAPLTPGQVLKQGRYVIDSQLGTGGQGVAYLGSVNEGLASTETSAVDAIVIKEFILPVYVDKAHRRQSLERFEREAKLLQGLDHPQVVKLRDYFVEDHRGYMVLEHINGWSLRRLVDEQGPLSEDEVVGLAKQMCDILAYLHQLSPPLVHRDFTPDNLILGQNGVLKLIDFNVAHQFEAKSKATVVGKHAYLPPEQFRGKPTTASDIYAMGATLYFLLTGEDPPPLTASHPILARAEVSKPLDDLVVRATALDTRHRFSNAQEVRDAVNALSGDQPADDTPPDGTSNSAAAAAGSGGTIIDIAGAKKKEEVV